MCIFLGGIEVPKYKGLGGVEVPKYMGLGGAEVPKYKGQMWYSQVSADFPIFHRLKGTPLTYIHPTIFVIT